MIVYKQNVDDVLRELNRVVKDMKTLANMYPLDEPISLQEAIGYSHSAQNNLTGLRDATPSAAKGDRNDSMKNTNNIEEKNGEIDNLRETIRKQNQILIHINAEIEFIKQHPFDLVLIDGSIENISKVIKGQIEPIIDEGCVGCCKVVDVAAKLQEELDASRSLVASYNKGNDRIKERLKAEEGEVSRLRFIISRDHGESVNLQKELNEYKETVRLERIDHMTTLKTVNQYYQTIIKALKDKNIDDLKELYDFYESELFAVKCVRKTAMVLSSEIINNLEAELSARKDDSEVLKKVVDVIEDESVDNNKAANLIADIVGYYDAPEGPPEKYKVDVENPPIDKLQGITAIFLELL